MGAVRTVVGEHNGYSTAPVCVRGVRVHDQYRYNVFAVSTIRISSSNERKHATTHTRACFLERLERQPLPERRLVHLNNLATGGLEVGHFVRYSQCDLESLLQIITVKHVSEGGRGCQAKVLRICCGNHLSRGSK